MRVVLATLCCLITASAECQKMDKPATLRDSISIAIHSNPRTRATDEFLESLRFATLAQKANYLPYGDIGCNAVLNRAVTDFQSGDTFRTQSTAPQCAISASATLFDGGAGRARFRAAQARERATRNAYNTSDSLITNTRGALATSTADAFLQLVTTKENIAYYRDLLVVLRSYEKFSSDATLKSAVVDIETALTELEIQLPSLEETFKFFTTVEPADKMESLDQTIESLKIPMAAEQALVIALKQGPEVLRRNAEVEAAKYELKAVKSSYGPQVSLNVTLARSAYSDRFSRGAESSTSSGTLGVGVRIPLSPVKNYAIKSGEKALSASERERESAIATATYSISSTYRGIEDARKTLPLVSKNYDDQIAEVRSIVQRIESGNTAGLDITKMLAATTVLGSRFDLVIARKSRMIQMLFVVQQITGLLFTDFAPLEAERRN